MSWIDVPVADIITYFADTFYYFMSAAVQIGTIIGIFGICWCSVKLAFGTMEIQKAIIGTFSKFIFFLVIINLYPVICNSVRNVAVEMGMNASSKPRTVIVTEFKRFLEQLEAVVGQENDELAAELSAAIVAKQTLVDSQSNMSELQQRYRGYSVAPSSANFEDAQSRINKAQAAIDMRQENPSGNMKTVQAIKSVLKPLDAEGNLTDASNAKYYVLDLTLKDKDGNDTGYLSPNAMLRIALLSAQIMWEKEWASVVEVWEENDQKGFFSKMTKSLSFAKFPVARLFDITLVFICEIAIVLAMIFSLLQYVACIVEFTIVISVGVICIPCILMDELKDIANKVMPSILAQAVKLTMITLCMFFAVWAFLGMAMNTIGEGSGFNLTTFASVMFTILLTFALTQFGPKLALALLNGQPQLSTGELVGAMTTAAAVGGGALRAATIGSSVAQKAVPAMARGTVNRMGDLRAVTSAGKAAREQMREFGGSDSEQGRAGLKAMAGEAGYRMSQGFKSKLHGAAHRNMSSSGMGSTVGNDSSGINRFGFNDDDYVRQYPGLKSMNYGKAQDEQGRALTAKEFTNEQAKAAAERARRNMQVPEARKAAKNKNTPAKSRYEGTDAVSPDILP